MVRDNGCDKLCLINKINMIPTTKNNLCCGETDKQ